MAKRVAGVFFSLARSPRPASLWPSAAVHDQPVAELRSPTSAAPATSSQASSPATAAAGSSSAAPTLASDPAVIALAAWSRRWPGGLQRGSNIQRPRVARARNAGLRRNWSPPSSLDDVQGRSDLPGTRRLSRALTVKNSGSATKTDQHVHRNRGFAEDPKTGRAAGELEVAPVAVTMSLVDGAWVVASQYSTTAFSCAGLNHRGHAPLVTWWPPQPGSTDLDAATRQFCVRVGVRVSLRDVPGAIGLGSRARLASRSTAVTPSVGGPAGHQVRAHRSDRLILPG